MANSFYLLSLLILASTIWAETPVLSWTKLTTTDGRSFSDVKVMAVESTGIKIIHKSGVARLNYLHLPNDARSSFQYDSTAAKKALDDMEKSNLQERAKFESVKAQQAAAEKSAREESAKAQKSIDRQASIKTLEELTANQVTVEKDRFTGVSSIDCVNSVELDGWVKITAWCTYEDLSEPRFMLYLRRRASSWRWLDFHDCYILVDGHSRRSKDQELLTEVMPRGGVYEAIGVPMDLSEAEAFVKSPSAAVKVGIDEYDLTAVHKMPMAYVVAQYQLELEKQKKQTK